MPFSNNTPTYVDIFIMVYNPLLLIRVVQHSIANFIVFLLLKILFSTSRYLILPICTHTCGINISGVSSSNTDCTVPHFFLLLQIHIINFQFQKTPKSSFFLFPLFACSYLSIFLYNFYLCS